MIKEINKTLYKKDSKGKIRVAIITTDKGNLIQETGIKDGALVKRSSFRKGKNIGKVNETSPTEQAISEAESLIARKIREGYFLTEEEASNAESWKPMLAKSYEKEIEKITFPCIVQPKLDGIRAVYKDGEFISRKNKEIDTMDHISADLPGTTGDLYPLDGELYIHNMAFQDLTSLIKKKVEGTSDVEYHVYDVMMKDKPYLYREGYISKLISELGTDVKIVKVESYIANSLEEIDEIYESFISKGYEGAMVRWGEEGYKCDARSSHLLKYKKFIDEAYELVDVTPANKDPEQGVPVCKLNIVLPLTTPKISWYKLNGEIVKVIGSDGVEYGYPTTRCGASLTQEQRKELLKNKKDYIGKMAEVRFFEKSNNGIPRFPVYHGIRLDK